MLSFTFIGVLIYIFTSSFFSSSKFRAQDFFRQNAIDTLEFAPGHPQVTIEALEQLRCFPAAQYREHHRLLPNFPWMDPVYLSGLLQPGYRVSECVKLSVQLQAELASNWHYYFLVNSNIKAHKGYADTNNFEGAWVSYANLHPELPTAAISFWAQVNPMNSGKECNKKNAFIVSEDLPEYCYIQNQKGDVVQRNFISPIIPISELQCDFKTQSMYVDSLLSAMKRPLQMINENGEVFRLYEEKVLNADKRLVQHKKKYADLNFNQFQAVLRMERELAFKNAFMQKPALSNCMYSVFAIDGQNDYRHDYATMRKINSKINNQYYATPDFYPRYPYNWRDWQGPWHGLKWLEIARETEIKLGDQLFSPFVAAGWDSIEVNNIRPAQWLGLLKILGALGAEFYYTGFFNLGKPFAIPKNYIWQAAMPSYAQGVTSFYEDILRNSKIIGEDLIQYPEYDVPTVIRKSNVQRKWIIACSWQTGSNRNEGVSEYKLVDVNLGHKQIKLKARRQGSVYVYSEENTSPICYQLDAWHEYKHPWHWRKNIILDAELYANQINTYNYVDNDFSEAISAALITNELTLPFKFHGLPSKITSVQLRVKSAVPNTQVELYIDDDHVGAYRLQNGSQFTDITIKLQQAGMNLKNGWHRIRIQTNKPALLLDRIELVLNSNN